MHISSLLTSFLTCILDKEHWEPVIAKIFSSTEGVKECWAFDSLSHGESALLNAKEIAGFSPCKACLHQ